jgi:NADH-quinone oxidoreductase subunit H
MDPLLVTIIVEVIKTGTIATLLMLGFAAMTVIERKLLARFTLRYGPNRVGKFGTLQVVADMFKMFFKEELVPGHVNRLVYTLAPALALIPALIGFAVVPLAKEPFTLPFAVFGTPITIHPWIAADVNVGILYLLAIGSLGT